MSITPELRQMVVEIVRESVRDAVASQNQTSVLQQLPASDVRGREASSGTLLLASTNDDRKRIESVRIKDDHDLALFTRKLLDMFENPKLRADLRNGWLRFSLIGASIPRTTLEGNGGADRASASTLRVEKGAVTERDVKAAAEAGMNLLLGKKAVVTPLARERARVAGVSIEKEQA
ncbi:hypothetical protein M3B11_02185 [Brevibacterium sp. p3-SID960]|uniref:hypothetical protein n=1 Tax=Brevibacterium sp. p3-SID960 TaxID=2916063 RepID=UPI0021A5CAEF|nr:hypothetical protein [Brevibacterium sp. p3-SID960]MCT1689777.1 hypothetical protein [Brevibacterium sp. p3-SID960]